MPENRPADDEPIDADVVEENTETSEAHETAAVDEEAVPGPVAATYVPPPADSVLPVVLLVAGLLVVLLVAVLFRARLAELYDRIVAKSNGKTAVTVANDATPAPAEPATKTAGTPATTVRREPGPEPSEGEGDTRVIPKFEKRELPKPPIERGPDIPAVERTRGYGYSRLERLDLSRDGVSKQQIKVMVPAHYGEAELRLVAENVIARERKLGECHAIRLFFFADAEKTEPADAVAEAVWAPEGKFVKAAEAVRAGSDNNALVIRMIDK